MNQKTTQKGIFDDKGQASGDRIIGTSALSESRNAMFLRVRDPCFFQAAITFNHFCRPEILAAIGFPRSARDCRKSMPAIL
jgi:hypothetical protein